MTSSIVPNDFAGLLSACPALRVVCFNGKKAASLFRKHVLPGLAAARDLTLHDLPSTSPANASIPFETKRAAWSVIARSEPALLSRVARSTDGR